MAGLLHSNGSFRDLDHATKSPDCQAQSLLAPTNIASSFLTKWNGNLSLRVGIQVDSDEPSANEAGTRARPIPIIRQTVGIALGGAFPGGLNPLDDGRIVEIGALELVNCSPTGQTFHRYICPERAMQADAIAVHGLTGAFLADKSLFAAFADEFLAFVGDAPLVAHNGA